MTFMTFENVEAPLRAPAKARLLITTYTSNMYQDCRAYIRFLDLDTGEQVDIWEFTFTHNSGRVDYWQEIMPNRDWHLRGEVGRIIDNEYYLEDYLDFTIFLFKRPTLNLMPFLIGGILLFGSVLVKAKK